MNLVLPIDLSPSGAAASTPAASAPVKSVLPRTFHGERTDKTHRVFELPWHRQAAHFLACGKSQRDTAKLCGVTPVCMNQVFGTPWFQELVIKLMEENGQNDLMALFKAELLNSHNTLVELRDNPQVSPTVRANIANTMIERIYGKPTQRVETSSTANISDPLAEEQRLREENERLRAVTGGAAGN